MLRLKARILIVFTAFALNLHAEEMPGCGVCSAPPGTFRAQSTPEISAIGEKTVLYIRLCYPDDPSEPVSFTAAESLMKEVSGFFRTNSYGQFWTRGTVTPLVQLPNPRAYYFPTNSEGKQFWEAFKLLADAREAARAAGYDPASYDLDMVRFKAPFFQSSGNIGRRGAWMVSSHPATTIHELGHNLGLQHANQWPGPIDSGGPNVEYGDRFDIMGNPFQYQLAGFHFLNKRALGWLTDANALEVRSNGVYRVYAHDVDTAVPGRTYALRVHKDDERDYWIEKRIRFDDYYDHMFFSGILPYWNAWAESNGGSEVLDPLGTGESLPVGTMLEDSAAGSKIIPVHLAEDHSYMDVAVVVNGGSRLELLSGWVHYSGETGHGYSLQVSADLRSWSDVRAQLNSGGELFAKIDPSAPRAFYRAVEAPLLK